MTTGVFLASFLIAGLTLAGASDVGICYGMEGNDLPNPQEVVALYKSQGINKMRIYHPNQQLLQALRGSDIELMLGVPNTELQSLTDKAAATRWVETNVLSYLPDVKIKYVAVGNEVTPINRHSIYAPFVVPAMTNIYDSIRSAGHWGQVKVSTSIDTGVLETSYPPSAASFRGNVLSYMNSVIGFLSDTQAPILVSVYPYFGRASNGSNITLPYVLFTKTTPEFTDPGNNLQYYNLFDAELDGLYAATEKVSGASSNSTLNNTHLSNVSYVVTETGHPKAASSGQILDTGDETIDNACTYYQNVIRHVRKGTPKRPEVPIETYLFAMFDENLKAPGIERHFGLFYPNKAPACEINFRE